MAPVKRPAAAIADGEVAPAKRRNSMGPPVKQWKTVAKAVSKAEGMPEDAAACLESMVGQALGVYKSGRHSFQEKVVVRIGEVLAATEKVLEAKSAEATSAAAGVDEEKAKRDQLVVESLAAVDGLSATMASAATAVEAAAKGVTDAKAAIADAVTKENLNARLLDTLAKERVVLDENRMLLTGPSLVPKKLLKKLLALGKSIGVDHSLLKSVEVSLGKTVEKRGEFDKIIVTNAEAKFAERSEGVATKIMAGLAAKEPCAKAVTDAQEALVRAKEQLKKCEAAFESDKAAHLAGVTATKAAQKSAKRVYADIKVLLDAMDDAKAVLEAFRAGPMATYAELKDAEAPPPPPAPVEEPEAASEAAPAA